MVFVNLGPRRCVLFKEVFSFKVLGNILYQEFYCIEVWHYTTREENWPLPGAIDKELRWCRRGGGLGRMLLSFMKEVSCPGISAKVSRAYSGKWHKWTIRCLCAVPRIKKVANTWMAVWGFWPSSAGFSTTDFPISDTSGITCSLLLP